MKASTPFPDNFRFELDALVKFESVDVAFDKIFDCFAHMEIYIFSMKFIQIDNALYTS